VDRIARRGDRCLEVSLYFFGSHRDPPQPFERELEVRHCVGFVDGEARAPQRLAAAEVEGAAARTGGEQREDRRGHHKTRAAQCLLQHHRREERRGRHREVEVAVGRGGRRRRVDRVERQQRHEERRDGQGAWPPRAA
jgi:hypothetical protein